MPCLTDQSHLDVLSTKRSDWEVHSMWHGLLTRTSARNNQKFGEYECALRLSVFDYCLLQPPSAIPRRRGHRTFFRSQPNNKVTMRFPSFAFAAVAGLWQQPLAPKEETITSTRHIHITRTITNSASTIYAVRMGTATVYMEYRPATMMSKSIPWQALPTTHLELRSEATSTMHIKVTQTVAQVQATVFASKVGTSISTITDAPQSLIDEAAKDAAELSSSQLAAAISSAEADALAHSTVAFLASTEASAPSSPTQSEPAQHTNSSSASTLTKPLAANPSERQRLVSNKQQPQKCQLP
ncbi:hypothetical protein KCV03_g79, partial [Aureobasidium melanogenum]